jgi:hypothetical protein
MWRLLGFLGGRRLVREFQLALDRSIDQARQVSIGLIFVQAGLLFVTFAIGFGLVGLFFSLAGQDNYVGPATVTSLSALAPALITFLIASRLFRHR